MSICDKKTAWTVRVLRAGALLVGIYILTAPFILPRVAFTRVGETLYRPVLYSLEKDWWGRDIVDWYCYNVCKMDLLVLREPKAHE